MNSIRHFSVAVAIALIASACFDDSSADAVPAPDAGDLTDTDSDRPCDGGAFPDDDEFRELLCAMQWAQIDIAAAGGVLDPSWVARSSEAILLYADDRAAAAAEIEAITAEMNGATPAATPPTNDADASTAIDLGNEFDGLQNCMVDVARLIIEANVSAGFDPARVDEWQNRAGDVDALVDVGDLAAAEDLVCELRDEIAAAIADSSLIPS